MRPAVFPLLAARLLAGAAFAAPAAAQDAASERAVAEPAAVTEPGAPLLLRIRPRDEVPVDGSGDETAVAAREAEAVRLAAVARAAAAWEAFEARITARANRAIASVCTGCLGPVPPSVALAPPDAAAVPVRPIPVAMTEP